MDKYQKLDLIEAKLKAEAPTDSIGTIYARMYGKLTVMVTDEAVDQLLKFEGISLDNLAEVK